MKKLGFLLLAVALMLPLTANGKGESGGSTYKIGVSMFNLTSEYLTSLKTHMEKYVAEKPEYASVKLVFLDAQSDPVKQNSQVDNLITQKVNSIVMIPFDREQQVPAVEAAAKAGVPLIEMCASTVSDKKRSYVGSDDKQSGLMLAQEMFRNTKPDAKIIVLHGPTGQNAQVMRYAGLKEVMKKYPNAKIVAEKVCDWDRSRALDAIQNIIQSGMEFDAIFSENDEMAMGALLACEGAGVKGKFIGGVDAIPDALLAVEAGRLNCTVFQNSAAQARTAVDVAVKLAKGESIQKLYDIPYELVTKANVAKYK